MDRHFAGLLSDLKAYFVERLDNIETSDEFLEHLKNVARAYGYQKQGAVLSVHSALDLNVTYGTPPVMGVSLPAPTVHRDPSF